jgi:glycosyltransferase involved in cell wall biosynthesis
MISLVLTYYNRERQLLKTLESFCGYKDINVIIVDDNSPEKLNLKSYPFTIYYLRLNQKAWINPAPVFNYGFNEALKYKPEAVIIQNAECYHRGDIISAVRGNLTDKNYISFACYSLGKGEDVAKTNLNAVGAKGNGDSAWYNHSVYRPEAFHFCCAITTENLVKINGFDERFAPYLGWEDNYLIHQIKTLGLSIHIIDNPFVFHQYHYDVKAFEFDNVLYHQASALCTQLKKEKNYRAKHILTPDLCI